MSPADSLGLKRNSFVFPLTNINFKLTLSVGMHLGLILGSVSYPGLREETSNPKWVESTTHKSTEAAVHQDDRRTVHCGPTALPCKVILERMPFLRALFAYHSDSRTHIVREIRSISSTHSSSRHPNTPTPSAATATAHTHSRPPGETGETTRQMASQPKGPRQTRLRSGNHPRA